MANDFDSMMASDQMVSPPPAAPLTPATVPDPQPLDQPEAPTPPPVVPVSQTNVPTLTRLEGGDFDEMMVQDRAAEQMTAKANFMASEGKDPDQSAHVYNLSTKLGSDPSFVERNYDKLKNGIDVGQIDFDKLSRLHPSIAKLANDPVKAAAVKDQVTTLSKFDNSVKDYGLMEDAYNIVGYGVAKLAADVSKIPAAMYDVLALKENAKRYLRGDQSRVTSDDTFFGRNNLATLTLEEMASGFREKLPILNEAVHEAFLKDVHSAANASLPERMYDAVAQGDYVRGGQVLFAQTAAFVPTLVAMAGAAMVNPALAPAMFGATSLAEHNAANLEAGRDPLVGTPNAMVHGAVAGYFTQFGVNAYFGTLAKRLSSKFGPEVAGQVMKSFGGSILKAAGAEGATMSGMSLADDFADYAMGVNPDALKGSLGRAFDAGLMGATVGGATHLGGETIVKAHEMRRASAVRDFMADLVERSKNKLNERSPELHSEFMKDSVAGTEAENVQVSPEAIETYFQSKNVNPVKAMQDLGFLDQFGHAKETGTNVKIPAEKFIQYVAKNGFEDLVNDVKFSEEDMSVNEINARAALEASFNKVDDEGIRAAEEIPAEPGLDRRGLRPDQANEEQAESIRKEFAKQLTDAGQDPTQAIVLSKILQTQAERVGVSPLDLYNQHLVKIKGEGPAGSGRTFNQEATGGLEETVPGEAQTRETGQRPGAGGGPGALSEAVRDGAAKLPKLPSSSPGPVGGVRDRARAYVESRGREYRPQSEYVTVDPERGARIADEYARMEHRPNDPDVIQAYDALINETLDQYQSIKESGLKIEAIKPGQENPYPNGSADLFQDIKQGHLWFFPTDQGFGQEGSVASDNPLLRMTDETLQDGTKLKANDVFRIVHDYFGHAKEGVSFGANGEENAWQSHVRMYSDQAARAMTTETRGQNSWVNFGPQGEANRADPANTTFANQKTGLLPAWVMTEGLDQGRRTLFQTDLPRPAIDSLGFFSQVDQEVGKMQFKTMPANDLLNRIKNIQGIKKEELEALGLEDYLKLRAEEGAKVSKDEVQSFVRDNGLKLEQVVLGTDYQTPREDKSLYQRRRDGEITTEDVQWDDAERDQSADSDSIDTEYDYYRNDAGDEYWADEQADYFAEHMEEYTDEDGEVDQAGLEKAWDNELDRLALARAVESVNSDDYYSAYYKVYEHASDSYIYGSDEYGWHDGNGNELGDNLNEAQIKHIANLVDSGDMSYPPDPEEFDGGDALPTVSNVNAVTGRAKFDRYAVDGATNYREVLLKLPDNREGGDFQYRAHFDQKNILAHVRISDRVDANGKKVLFLEEVQSDWHQQGRERGYADKTERFPDFPSWLKETQNFTDEQVKSETDVEGDTELYRQYNTERHAHDQSVPDAPFKQTDAWASLALKRMLRMAVEEGYDSIAWTPADVHIDRWGTDDVTWVKVENKDPASFKIKKSEHSEGRYEVQLSEDGPGNGTKRSRLFDSLQEAQDFAKSFDKPHFLVGSAEQRGGRADGMNIEELARHRGELLERRGERVTTKEELRKIIGETLGRERDDRSLDSLTDRVWKQMESGDPSGALQPRAEGMKFFYDKVIPDTMKKLLKKIDPNAKIEVGGVKTRDGVGYSAEVVTNHNTGERSWALVDGKGEIIDAQKRYATAAEGDAAAQEMNAKNPAQPEMQPSLTIPLTDTMKKVVGEQGLALFQNQDGTPRGQITFGKTGAEIRLFANANKSTFFHEVGHFAVEMMRDLVNLEDAPFQLKEDFATLMNFVGHEGGEITTEQHEKLARGFEEYIMEGKAPSSALARAFTRFKTWLVDVYKALKNNDVELSDEVRAVFDRVLATDAEIESAKSIQEIKPLFTEGTLPKGVHERYMKAFEAVQMAAENELRSKVMEDIRKEETELYKQELEESVHRMTEQVKTMPVYQALSILQRGRTVNDETLPEQLRDLKIDRKALVDAFGEEIIQKLPKPVIYKKDGMHHDMVADLLGYDSAKKMIEDFTRYPKMSEFIENGAKADMELKSPNLFKSTYMPELAMEAIHNDQRSTVLRMELDLLREKAPGVVRDLTERIMKRPLPDRQLREQMEGEVGKQVVADLSPNKYRVAERQAGREAAKAFANGDFAAAFDAKTRELKNYQLFKAAAEAKAETEKSLKFFKKLGAPDEKLSKTRDMNLVNTARAVLASYGIGKTDAAPIEYLKKMEAYDPQAFEAATYHVHAATEGGQAANYKSLPYGRFRAMADAVKALYELAKSSKEIEINGKRMVRDQVVEDLVNQLSNYGDLSAARPGMRKAITFREATKMNLMGAKASLRRVEHWAHAVDGEDYGGVTVKTLVEPIKDAESKMHLRKAEVMKDYRDNVVHPSKDIFKKVDIEAPEIDYTFHSKSELLGALMHTGNESNFSKLLRGRGWGDVMEDGSVDRTRFNQMTDRLQKDGTLTKQDYDYLQGVWNMYEKLKPDAQRAHFKMYGFHFNEVTADPFQTPFGEYKGGYAPAVADPNISEDAALRREKESFGNKMDMTLMPTGGRGFTKSRVEAYAAPLAMDLRYVPMQIDKVLRFTYMEPVVRDLSKVVLDRRYTNALGAIDSAARSEMLIPYLQRAATQATTTPSGTGKGYKMLDTVFRKMRGSTGLNAMTLNVVNAFHQTTGFAVAGALVEPRYIRDATIRYIRQAADVTHAMHEKSEYMRAKESGIGELQADIEELMNKPGKIAQGEAWIKKNSYILQKYTAGMTEAVAWTGGYDKAIAEGKTEAEAVKFGDSVVRRTQHSASPTDVARFGTGTPFQRLFTMYFDYFNNKANLNLTQAGNMTREFGVKKGMAHMWPLYVATMMIPAIMTKAAYRVAEGKFDENDDGQYMDDVLELFFHSQVDEALTSVPIAGPMLTTLGKTFNDKPTDDRMSLSPAIELAARAMIMPRHIYDFTQGKGKPSGAIRDVLSLAGLFTGLPLQPLAKPLGYAADVGTGAVESSGPIDYTRGLITGYGPRR